MKKIIITTIILLVSVTSFCQTQLDLIKVRVQESAQIDSDEGIYNLNSDNHLNRTEGTLFVTTYFTKNIKVAISDVSENPDKTISITGSYSRDVYTESNDIYLGESVDYLTTDVRKFTCKAKQFLDDFVISEFQSEP